MAYYKDNFDKEKIIDHASKSLGTDSEKVRQAIDSGNLDAFANKLSPDKAKQLKDILSDEKKLEQMLSTPQAKALFKKLMGK